MINSQKLILIKIVHTLIWIFFVSIIFYVVYCGITGHINIWTWVATALVVVEGAILIFFGNYCPLTLIARRYSDSKKDNFDIFLPNKLAKYNKLIFTTIYLIGLILLIYRQL
jgi:hypothetical protein